MTETLQGNDFRDSGWLQSLQKDDVQLLICPLMLLVSLMKRQCPSLYLAPGRILNFTASRKRKRKKVWVLQLHTDVADLILSKPGRDPACTPRLKQKKKHFFLSARKPLQILTKAASSVPNYLRKTAHCLPWGFISSESDWAEINLLGEAACAEVWRVTRLPQKKNCLFLVFLAGPNVFSVQKLPAVCKKLKGGQIFKNVWSNNTNILMTLKCLNKNGFQSGNSW